MSGLKINVHKSKISGINVDHNDVYNMALVLGCGAVKLPMMYLGVPVGCNMGRCEYWNQIIHKFESKLSQWNANLLSVGGRLSLIKAVLGNVPTYFMSLYKMPSTIMKRLESMRNRFFLGGNLHDKKITWVKWETCLASKAMGGLGIGSIFALNAALLFKWVWRFRTCPNSLWVQVIKSIHGVDGAIGPSRLGISSSSPWISIVQHIFKLQAKGIDLLAFCSRTVGNGNSTRFWTDSWCGVCPLKDLFPRVYALDANKSCLVSHRLPIEDWSSVLRRIPRSGAESSQFQDMMETIRQVPLTSSIDKWKWDLDASGFTVSSTRSHIDDHYLFGSHTPTRWSRLIPIKANVLVWRMCLDKLPTLTNLDKKGIDVPSLLCPVCSDQVETADHLFFSCNTVQALWGLLARWCQLDFPGFANIADWFSWLDSARLPKHARLVLEGIASTMFWSLWNFRNAWIFSSSKPKKANIWDSVVHQSFLWISSRNPKFRFRWIDWLRNPIDTHM
ncbi:RNA-directed DNA polymerase, eukaryota, reverse transcriptase zinc-binding domain protein [Tanacetum coccineum]